VDVALKAAAETKLAQDVLNDAPNGAKRSAEDEDEDEDADADADEDAHGEIDEEEELIVMSSNLAYNTRFKGVKRVKMEREGPEVVDRPPQRRRGRPRKSAPAALIETGTKKSGSTAAAAQASGSMVDPQQPVKRGRGRPRKNPIPPAPETPHKSSPTNSPSSKKSGGPPDSRGRQIFDGVVLPQRPKKALVPVSLSGLGPDHHDPDADADGDMDAEAEAEVEEGAWVHSSTVQNSELAGTEQGNKFFSPGLGVLLLRVRL